jgi:uncharacterized protein YqeY
MEEKNINTLVKTLVEKIRDLELELSLTKYERDELKKEKEGKPLDETIEASVLMKMVSQREDSINQFKQANRMDLAENEQKELDIIKEFAPKQVSDEDITIETEKVIANMGGTVTMKDMKNILAEVQKVYPTANGKLISQIVKSHC